MGYFDMLITISAHLLRSAVPMEPRRSRRIQFPSEPEGTEPQ